MATAVVRPDASGLPPGFKLDDDNNGLPAGFKLDDPAPAAPEQPGFFKRAGQALGVPEHPLDALEETGKEIYHHPLGSLYEGTKELSQGIGNMAMHPVQATRGPEFAEDIANKNYRGAAGTIAGDVAPWLLASPEVREGALAVPGRIAEAAGDAKAAVGRTLREPGAMDAYTGTATRGKFKPVVGAVTPSVLGTNVLGKVADAVIPAHPEPMMRFPRGGLPENWRDLTQPLPVEPGKAPPPGPVGTSTASALPGAAELPKAAPRDVTTTGAQAALNPPPGMRPTKLPGQVLRVPEPTSGDPRWVASTPRGKLPGLAMQGREGAAQQLQNIGQTVLMEPKGAGITNVREVTRFPEGQEPVSEPGRSDVPAAQQSATKNPGLPTKVGTEATPKPAEVGKTAEPGQPAQLTPQQVQAARREITQLRASARQWSDRMSSSQNWRKANQYMRNQQAAEERANQIEEDLGNQKVVGRTLTGATKEELNATYNGAPPEVKAEVDRLVDEYGYLDTIEKRRFETQHGFDRATNKGLPTREKIAKFVTAQQERAAKP